MAKVARESLWIHEGGWVLYSAAGLPGRAWIRFREAGGRLVACELRVEADRDAALDTDALRSVPLGRIDAIVNGPQATGYLREWIDNAEAQNQPGLPGTNVAPLQLVDGRRKRAVLPQPAGGPGRDHGDDFYRRVAANYSELTRTTRAPTQVLAEMNGVPVSTSRRWVKEARARGFLPPGTPGKAG